MSTITSKTGFLTIVALVSVFALKAQNGWDDIRNNDNINARIHFMEMLKKDSINKDALHGLIYISELEGDVLNYKKHSATLIRNFKDENDFLLFKDYIGKNAAIAFAGQFKYSEAARMEWHMKGGEDLENKDQRDQAAKEFRKWTDDFKWSVIGPFKNLCGSGHITEFSIEKDAYDESRLYKDDNGIDVHWQECKIRNRNGFISFDNNLPESRSSTYYANTFLNFPASKTIQIRIARSSPLKIWLDNKLIFDHNENLNWGYDNEILTIKIQSGIHRLLLKSSPMREQTGAGSKYYNYEASGPEILASDKKKAINSYQFFQDYSSVNAFGIKSNYHYTATPLLRITDTSGNLISNISSDFNGAYQSQDYVVALSEKYLIKYYQDLILKNPDYFFNYYALCLAYINANTAKEGEYYFLNLQRKNPNIVFFKYLIAKTFAQNGKMEKFYEVLNNIDHQKTPIYVLLYDKFKEKDKKTDKDEWLSALKTIYTISPSSYDLIMEYLKYYNEKGMNKEKDSFGKAISEKYPEYKDAIEKFLKDNKEDKDNSYDYDNGKGSRLSNAMSDLFGREGEYTKLKRYKKQGNISMVCKIYDKWQKEEPWTNQYIYEKASYLKDKKKYDNAIAEARKGIAINEYEEKYYELIADAYKDKELKDSAIYYYNKAKYYATGSYKTESIETKMEKVMEQKSIKKIFETKKFEEILADKKWARKYTDEEAVVLLYTRDLVVDENNHCQVFTKIMVKILKDAGVVKWTEYNFGFLGRTKYAKVLKKNGSEVIPDIMSGYSVFKNLSPGDIIEIEGQSNWSPQSELGNEITLNAFFTFDAPVYYAKYEVAVKQGKFLNHLNHNLEDNLVKYTKEGYDFYKWEYQNIRKMEREDASLDQYDKFGTIMISTMKDWSTIVEWMDEKTYKKLDATYEVKEILDSIIKPGMADTQKVRAIYNYLTKEIKYSYVSFMQSGQIPKRCGLTLSSKIGDCKDVATVMVSMLRQVGIESYYTLVKTNHFDHFEYLPSQYFDHMIAAYYIGGALHFADMTTDFYPHYVLTDMDAHAFALLIKPGNTSIMRLPQDDLDPKKNHVVMNIDAEINTDRSLKIKVKASHPGMAGGMIRERYTRYTQDQKKNQILEMMGRGVFQNLDLKDYHYSNIPDISSPLESEYDLEAAAFCDKVAGLLIFRAPFMTAIEQSQAMLSKTRYNRLNVKALSSIAPTTQKLNIKIPDGWKLIELPEDVKISGKYGVFTIHYSKTKDGLHIEKYQQFNEDEIPVSEYDNFKAYYQQILEADGTRMALQKK